MDILTGRAQGLRRAVLASAMLSAGAIGALGPAEPAAAAGCSSYTLAPGQLVTHDYEDPWWDPGDEITLRYPGMAWSADGMHNGSVAYPPASTFVVETGANFQVNLYERDSGYPDRHLPDALVLSTATNTSNTHWFSIANDYKYSLSYSLWSNGPVECPVTPALRTVPDVIGTNRAEARRRIEAAGLKAYFIGSTSTWARAVDQDPHYGYQLPAGSSVNVFMEFQ